MTSKISEDEALRLIEAYQNYLKAQAGYEPKLAPSYVELVTLLGLSSTSQLAGRWSKLERMGLVVCVRRGNRCFWRLTLKGMEA